MPSEVEVEACAEFGINKHVINNKQLEIKRMTFHDVFELAVFS